jgi:hypothetical protein
MRSRCVVWDGHKMGEVTFEVTAVRGSQDGKTSQSITKERNVTPVYLRGCGV